MNNDFILKNIKILSVGNIKLNVNIYEPDKLKKGIIIITHGYGEHSGYYNEFSAFFANKGFVVVAYDLRSYGLSEGKRGHVPKFDFFIDDLQNIINYIKNTFTDLPVYLFGHSMGGSIVLNYLLKRNNNQIKKAIISSPWLKLAFEPPKGKLLVAKIGKILFPSLVIKGELKTEELSRDKNWIKKFDSDPLTYDSISPGYFFEIRNAGLWALENADKWQVPILMSHGDNDNITSITASKEFCDKAGALCEFKKWEGGYRHVVYSEENKNEIFDYFYSYLVDE